MAQELVVKTSNFWSLLQREQFISETFEATLRYRIPEKQIDKFYIDVVCANPNFKQYTETYIESYLNPKYERVIQISTKTFESVKNSGLLSRLMKEYVVHIDCKIDNSLVEIHFYSLDLSVLCMVFDDFVNATKSCEDIDSAISKASDELRSNLLETLQTQHSVFEALDQSSSSTDEDSVNSDPKPIPKRKSGRKAPKKSNIKNNDEKTYDNDLIKELRGKLAGRKLRPVIIDGANVGATFGEGKFSAEGIQIVVNYFKACGYPDEKIVAIIPTHYQSKGPRPIVTDLIERKILILAFHQKFGDELRKFYDDRLIIDTAVVKKGVIISNDFYRDILKTAGEAVRNTIQDRLLCYRFVGKDILFPDPIREHGSSLDKFLSE